MCFVGDMTLFIMSQSGKDVHAVRLPECQEIRLFIPLVGIDFFVQGLWSTGGENQSGLIPDAGRAGPQCMIASVSITTGIRNASAS